MTGTTVPGIFAPLVRSQSGAELIHGTNTSSPKYCKRPTAEFVRGTCTSSSQ